MLTLSNQSKKLPHKSRKSNSSINLEEVIPAKKVVAAGTKESSSFKRNSTFAFIKCFKKVKYIDIVNY